MAKALLLDSSWSAEWNRFVSEAVDSSPYHRFEWMEAVEAAYGHKAYPLAVEEEGTILAVLPLVLMAHPLKKRASLVSLPFCDLGGIIGSEQHQHLLRATASDLAKRMNAQLLEIRHREREGLGYDFDRLGKDLDDQKVSMLLELEASSEKQLAAFKPKLRSQIKKAIKNGCTTVVGNTPELVEDFYYVFSRNMLSLGSPVHSKAMFHAICKAYGDNAVVAVIYFEGEVAAAAVELSLEERLQPFLLIHHLYCQRVRLPRVTACARCLTEILETSGIDYSQETPAKFRFDLTIEGQWNHPLSQAVAQE